MKRLSFSRLTKKQWLIVGVLAAVLLTSIVGAVVITKERAQQEALRQDKAKFEQLDAKMQKVLAEFQKIAPEGEWKYEKSCSRTGGKFENSDDTKFCNLTVASERNFLDKFDNLAIAVERAGFPLEDIYESERSKRVSRSYEDANQDMYCHLSSGNAQNLEVTTFYNCDTTSLEYYYPYVR